MVKKVKRKTTLSKEASSCGGVSAFYGIRILVYGANLSRQAIAVCRASRKAGALRMESNMVSRSGGGEGRSCALRRGGGGAGAAVSFLPRRRRAAPKTRRPGSG